MWYAAARPAWNKTIVTDIPFLRRHATIGWDLDDTLIGHPASASMHAFIRATPMIRHILVTFRTSSGAAAIWTDLARVPLTADASCFVAVETMDDGLAEAFQRQRRQRLSHLLSGPPTAVEIAYRSWKGAVCARLGATVLIDDMTDHVAPGCTLHGVALLHPDVLLARPA